MLRAQQMTDVEMRRLLRDSAREARIIIERHGDGIGREVRQAQLEIARSQQLMWRRAGGVAANGVERGAVAASESFAKLMRIYLSSMGVDAASVEAMILAQGRAGIAALLARGAANIPLSQQVYRTSVQSGQQLDRMLNALILNGASAKEIAQRVYKFVDPLTPGGSSYAAMRLGRTELNNAFHTTSKQRYQDNPFIDGVKWSLSKSHPKPDLCDQYAGKVFDPDEVPDKPHPQCFCYLEPQVPSDAQFKREFKAGKYDGYIDNQIAGSAVSA
jgi:hypothetical protein